VKRAARFLPGAAAVVVAWAIPTTATANSCGSSACITTFPHLWWRALSLGVGLIVVVLLTRLEHRRARPRRLAREVAVLAALIVGFTLLVAIRFPAGIRQEGITFHTDTWFEFRLVLAAAGRIAAASTTWVLTDAGDAGRGGLRLLGVAVPTVFLVAALVVPTRLHCPPGPWFPNDRTHSCVNISRLGITMPPPPASSDPQWPVRVGLIAGAIVSRLSFARLFRDRGRASPLG
jgi:hypothetical protein